MLNSKASPLPAANEFRSVTFTTPTPSMLAAMMNASFGDDVYQEYHITTEFQKEVARLTEMEDVLFMLSGTMGNQFSSDAVQDESTSRWLNVMPGYDLMMQQTFSKIYVCMTTDNYIRCLTKTNLEFDSSMKEKMRRKI
jgi:hypothetical protein